MSAFSTLILIVALLRCLLVSAADTRWLNPNGSEQDFSQYYTLGSLVQLSWQALNNSLDDLWLTSYDVQVNDFALKIADGINITNPGNYNWNVAVNATQVNIDNHFQLVFVPTGVQYTTALALQKQSGGFILRQPSLSSTILVTTTVTATPKPTTSKGAAAPTDNNDLSTGVKVGIAFGAIGSLLLAAGLGCLVSFHVHTSRQPSATLPHGEARILAHQQCPSCMRQGIWEKDGGITLEISASRMQPVELESPSVGTLPTMVRSALDGPEDRSSHS